MSFTSHSLSSLLKYAFIYSAGNYNSYGIYFNRLSYSFDYLKKEPNFKFNIVSDKVDVKTVNHL